MTPHWSRIPAHFVRRLYAALQSAVDCRACAAAIRTLPTEIHRARGALPRAPRRSWLEPLQGQSIRVGDWCDCARCVGVLIPLDPWHNRVLTATLLTSLATELTLLSAALFAASRNRFGLAAALLIVDLALPAARMNVTVPADRLSSPLRGAEPAPQKRRRTRRAMARRHGALHFGSRRGCLRRSGLAAHPQAVRVSADRPVRRIGGAGWHRAGQGLFRVHHRSDEGRLFGASSRTR